MRQRVWKLLSAFFPPLRGSLLLATFHLDNVQACYEPRS